MHAALCFWKKIFSPVLLNVHRISLCLIVWIPGSFLLLPQICFGLSPYLPTDPIRWFWKMICWMFEVRIVTLWFIKSYLWQLHQNCAGTYDQISHIGKVSTCSLGIKCLWNRNAWRLNYVSWWTKACFPPSRWMSSASRLWTIPNLSCYIFSQLPH